jgi:hypothetical protein
LCCESPELQFEAFHELVSMQEDDSSLEQGCIHSLGRIQSLREAYFLNPVPTPGLEVVGCAAHRDLAHLIKARLS